jgi:D-alanyl-D-alanine carboxypeptidase (penicillin-binding protein 5/6)
MRLISVVMGAASDKDRTRASQALLNYGFRFYETRKLYGAGVKVTDAKVWQGEVDTVQLGVPNDVFVTFPRGRYDELDARAEIHSPLVAPIAAGQALGQVDVKLGDAAVANVPLTALAAVGEGSLVSRLIDQLMMMLE